MPNHTIAVVRVMRSLIATAVIGLLSARIAEAATRPNIVLVLADDMGFSDIASFGSEVPTPNLDRLATRGVRFTQFYNGARCCPSRASLMTGLYAQQAGVGHMIDNYARTTRAKLNSPAYGTALADGTPTLAEVLRISGYRTFMVGKWHLGHERPHWPVDRGFDQSLAQIQGSMKYFGPGKLILNDQPFETPTGSYLTDVFAKHAAEFIASAGKTPFFLYLAFNAPHWPLHAPPESIAKYRGKYLDGWNALRERRYRRQVELGIVNRKWPLSPGDPSAPDWNVLSSVEKQAWDLKMAVYAAQIDHLDRGVGRVMEALAASGVERDTLVIFLSDNGGTAEPIQTDKTGAEIGTRDSYSSYGLPWANVSNTPFRSYKHWVHEGGIATPFIAHWPAVMRSKHRIVNEPTHLVDLMATFVDLAGLTFPAAFAGHATLPPEGRSLRTLLTGKRALAARSLFWEHEGNRAVRHGRWKLVGRFAGPWELYDVAADRSELHDLAKEDPARVTALGDAWDAWAARAGVLPWPGN